MASDFESSTVPLRPREMDETRLSLIDQLGAGTEDAWREIDRIYRPLIHFWPGRYGLQQNDVEDLTQEVMALLARDVAKFEHNGRVGAFRKWLRTITANRAHSFLRSGRCRPSVPGSTLFLEMVQQLEDDQSRASLAFDHEHDRHVVRQLLAEVSDSFEDSTMQMFRRHVLDGIDAKDVADELGTSPRAVYIAKSRVLRQLRTRAADWLDEMRLS